MIEKLYKLSKVLPDKRLEFDPYRLELDELSEWKTLIICFSISDLGEVSYLGIDVEDYQKKNNLNDWFFKRAPGNEVSHFPTVNTNGSDLSFSQSNQDIKLPRYWNKLIRIMNNCCEVEKKLSPLLNFLDINAANILENLSVISSNKQLNYVVTIQVNNLPVGKSPLFKSVRDIACSETFKEFYTLGGKKIKKMRKVRQGKG